MTYRVLCVVGFLLSVFHAEAQTDFLTFRSLTISEGLTSNTVTAQTQDSVGYLWFGTDNGLSRYDGYNVRKYHSDERDSTTVVGNFVSVLHVDQAGRLWIGTRNGICRYCPEKDEFKRYKLPPGSKVITSICSAPDGNLWMVNVNTELFRLNESADEWIPIDWNSDVNLNTFSMIVDHDNRIWLGRNGVLTFFDPQRKKSQSFRLTNSVNGEIKKIVRIENFLWMTLYGEGVVRFNIKDFSFEKYGHKQAEKNKFLDCYGANHNILWLASGSGLQRIDTNSKLLTEIFDSNDPGQLDISCESVYCDRQGNVWVGTKANGVKVNENNKRFKWLGKSPGLFSLTQYNVRSIAEDQESNLMVGTSSTIDLLDSSSRLNSFYNKVNNPNSIGVDDIWKIFKDRGNNVWVSSYNGGLQKYDPRRRLFLRVGDERLQRDIRGIDQDLSGNLWLAVHGSGVCKIDTTGKILQVFNSKNGFLNVWTFDVICDRHGRTWVASDEGLTLIDKQDRIFTYRNDTGDLKSISDNLVHTIFEDSQGNIWAGTSRGLNLYHERENNFSRLLRKDGFTSDHICAIQEDNDGYIWFSTKGGILVKLDRNKWTKNGSVKFFEFSVGDGILAKEFNYNASHKDNSGKLYFGGSNGITFFDPLKIVPNSFVPNVVISNFKLFNEPSSQTNNFFGQGGSIQYADRLDLRFDQNVISFEFTAFNFIQAEKNQYTYILENFDKQWYTLNKKREVTYTNLPPGNYTLRVKGSNNDGVWNSKETRLLITIHPPWWKTIYFRLFLVVLIFTGFSLILFLRTRTIKERQKQLENLVNEKTAELNKQTGQLLEMADRVHQADLSKIRFFMNISHEFKTPLSLIISPAADINQEPNLPENVKDKFTYIYRNANRLSRLINQVLDLGKIEAGQLKLDLRTLDIMSVVTEVFHSFTFDAKQKGIDFELNNDRKLQQNGSFDPDFIEKILYNLISNAFKHTPENGKVIVTISMEDDQLKFSVFNSGVALNNDKIKVLFQRFYTEPSTRGLTGTGIGLSLVNELVELHGGKLKVFSEQGIGNTFSFTIPVITTDKRSVMTDSRVEPIDQPYIENGISGTKYFQTRESDYLILLVEDDDDLRTYLDTQMAQHYRVISCVNGKEAFTLANAQTPDLVLSDIMMPEIDGFSLCEMLKSDALLAAIPVILMTAKGEDSHVLTYELGADAYLAKPFTFSLLKARIDNLIRKRKSVSEQFIEASVKKQFITTNKPDELFLQRAIMIVENNLSDSELGIKDFSRELGVGKTNLYNKLGQLTGLSLNIFIRTIRLNKAAEMLLQEEYTVSEISYKVGFNDPNYFSKCFRQQFGKSPTEFILARN